MVWMKTMLVLLNLAIIVFSPHAPSTSDMGGVNGTDPDSNPNPNPDPSLGYTGKKPATADSDSKTRKKHLQRSTAKMLRRGVDGGQGEDAAGKGGLLPAGSPASTCVNDTAPCCSAAISKVLPLGKLMEMEANKHYLVRHVRIRRCPNNHGCCSSWRHHCRPSETRELSVQIPVERLIGRHQYELINETHSFREHVLCECQERTDQSLANYVARELLDYYDTEDALEMVGRICRAVQRRIRKWRHIGGLAKRRKAQTRQLSDRKWLRRKDGRRLKRTHVPSC